VVAKQASAFGAQRVFALWQALDNNVNGAGGAGFVFGRSLMGTATSNATYGGAGQVVTGLSMGTGAGYGNYHGGYVSFKANNFHGITLQENLTYSKALGLNSYNQSTSSIAAEDNFNLKEQYGRQGFDQKIIFNTFIVYSTPWYKNQSGIVGRLAGGWTLSPVVVAGTGQPLQCTSNNSGQNFGWSQLHRHRELHLHDALDRDLADQPQCHGNGRSAGRKRWNDSQGLGLGGRERVYQPRGDLRFGSAPHPGPRPAGRRRGSDQRTGLLERRSDRKEDGRRL
jgi:hypothetical protein